jgi:hypothetical protein
MADDDIPAQHPPTYGELVEQNEALKSQVADLQAAVVLSNLERDQQAQQQPVKKREPRKLDKNAPSAFDRPYNGG